LATLIEQVKPRGRAGRRTTKAAGFAIPPGDARCGDRDAWHHHQLAVTAGGADSEEDLDTIAQEARDASDRARPGYEKLIYDQRRIICRRCRAACLIWRDLRVGVQSVAMTGWRCGWSIGPAALIGADAIQSHATSNVVDHTKGGDGGATGSRAGCGHAQ
jgi:hypothetical protein